MPFDFASFVNPNQFSDAASLAGFDPNKPMRGISETISETLGLPPRDPSGGVVPPDQSFGDVMSGVAKQAIAPYQQKFDKLTNAAGQLGEGNFGNAANVMMGKKIQQPQSETVMPQHDYSHEWYPER